MPSIKVLRLIYDLQIGGVQRILLQTIPMFREAGIETEVCCLKEEGEMAEEFRNKGIKVHLIPFKSRLDPVGLFRLRRLITKNGFNIVHSHMYASNIAANVAMIGCNKAKVINSYHSQRPVHGNSQKRMAKLTKNLPDRIVAVSNAVLKPLLEAGIKKEKTCIIYNGVSCPDSPAPLPERDDNSPLELVWAGRFVKQKRVDMLVKLMEECKKEKISASMTIVGDGPHYENIIRMVKEYGLEKEITLTGWKENVLPYIENADLYISMSNREGFPNTLLEVSSRGRGFLVADIPPNREVLGSHKAGFVLGDDMSEWTKILKRLQSNRNEIHSLSKEAFDIAREFTIENTCQKAIDLYKELLKNN
jgi:glycosyltransferase involved in cell wall biosynthesis